MLKGKLIKYNSKNKVYSRNLRKNMTDAELLVWQNVRRKQIRGVQFNRQKPINNFIVDFYCHKAMLVIEIDGSQHFEANNSSADIRRDKELLGLGLKVLRFNNHQVLTQIEDVVEEIDRVVLNRLSIKNPP